MKKFLRETVLYYILIIPAAIISGAIKLLYIVTTLLVKGICYITNNKLVYDSEIAEEEINMVKFLNITLFDETFKMELDE